MLLNPRAVVPEAREEIKPEESAENVKKKFGDAKPASTAPAEAAAGGGSRGADGGGSRGANGGGSGRGGRGGAGGRPQMSFSDLDKNGDKKLTVDELPERMQPFFDTVDTNTDGAIDAKEFATFRAERKKRSENGGGQGGGAPGQ